MNTEKRASIVQEELMSLYGAPPIPLVHVTLTRCWWRFSCLPSVRTSG